MADGLSSVEIELRREMEALRIRGRTMSEVARRITESLDLDTILQEVVDGAREITGARYGAVAAFDEDGRVRSFFTSGLAADEREAMGATPEGLGLLGYLNEIREPLRMGDLSQHPRSVGFPDGHPPMGTFLGAPILHNGEPVGNIYLTEKAGRLEFTPEDEEALVLFASQAALAINNAATLGEERRARDEAETERRRLATLVNSSPVGVLVVDAKTRTVVSVNPEAKRILGVSPEVGSTLSAYQAMSFYRRSDGEEYKTRERPLSRALDLGEVARAEEVIVDRLDGGKIMALVNSSPIYSEDGEIVSAVAVIQDMTPLEELERLRNEFLAMVSHELRTPLTLIKGSASVALDSARPPSTSAMLQYFRIIDEQSDHLTDLVNNLLDLTRIEAGALSVDPKPVDALSMMEEARTLFLRRGGRHRVEIDVADGLPQVKADRQRIVQVLNNLLSNAEKNSPETEPIRVDAAQRDIHVVFTVTDAGSGIPSDQTRKVFRKFFSLDDAKEGREPAGQGLGLAICKGIVEAHGGRIVAKSAGAGGGARLLFSIPHAVEGERADAAASPVGATDRPRILTVDDEAQILRLLQNILVDRGFATLAAANADEMFRLLELERPHLVLLDLMMPGSNGFDLLQRVKRESDASVILLSANDEEKNVVKALGMGADDYIVKPFSPTELVARVEASLRKRVAVDSDKPRAAFRLGDLTIDYAAHCVYVSGDLAPLSSTEYKLVYELSNSAGRILTQDQILARVWGWGYSGESGVLRATVRNVRRKLHDDARHPKYILTEPRVGYIMPKP